MEKTDPIQVISNLEAKFNNIIIPENELPNISSNDLKQKKSELEILKEQLLNFEKDNKLNKISVDNPANNSFIYTKTENIIEKIILEIKLYEQFINKTENRLTLDEILKESNDLPEEYIDDIQSLTSSKIQNYFDNNLHIETQSVSSSLSSPTFKRNKFNSFYNGPPKSISRYRRTSESNHLLPSKSNFSYVSIKAFGNQIGNAMPPGPSDVFQWTKLRTISEQLYSKRIKEEIGMPTVFCIKKYIVFGMSNGAVLVYDLNQNLKVMFGFTNEGIDISPVTSIAISPDNAYVASGHQNGKITIWDIEQSTKVKEILPNSAKGDNKKKMHQENSTITFIDFISTSEIISADNKGMIFYHLIQKILMIYYVTTTKLYGSEKMLELKEDVSPILSLSVLTKGNANHPIEDTNLVALSTTDSITVFSMKPEINVQYCDKWNKDIDLKDPIKPITCSCLSWYPALKTEKGTNIRINDPLLAYSYNNHLTIVRVSKHRKYNNKYIYQFISIGNWKSKNNITLIRWLNTQYIVLMDSQENLIIFDVQLMNSVEKSDVCKKQILCQSINSFSSNLNFEAITYHHSVQSFKGRLCILCRAKFYIVSLFSWEERISTLIRSGNIVEAISIAIDFYKNNGKHAVMNLPTDNEKRMADTSEYIEKLLVSYVNMTLVVPVDYEYINPEMSDKAVYQHLSHICFEVCITINRFDLLYGHIYDKFSECHLQDIFFETLEIYILNHKIDKLYTEDNLNPSISDGFINYFYEKKWYSRLEECIILIDPTLLNIDHIIKIFRDKKLFKGLIYIYSHVLKDSISPIIEILMDLMEIKDNNLITNNDNQQDINNSQTKVNFIKLKTRSENNVDDIKNELNLQNNLSNNSKPKSEGDINKNDKSREKSVTIIDSLIENNEEVKNVNYTKKIYNKKKKDIEYMLYVFLAYSLSGKSFPFGLPNKDNPKEAKIQCYNFLFSKNYIKWQYRKEFKDIVIGSTPYPYLKELLKRNTNEMLKVLGAAFEDTSMNEEIILDPDYLKIDKDTSLISKTNQFIINSDIDYVDFDNADKSLKKINYQYIIHILFNVIENNNEFSNHEVLQFYEFISRMISKFSTFIYLEEDILEKIYNFLLNYKEDEFYIKTYNEEKLSREDLTNSTLFVNSLGLTVWESRDMRQRSIQSILSIYNPPESEEILLKKYKKAKYFKLCENIYLKNKKYAKVIECYIFDRYRQKDVYQCIFEILHLSNNYQQPLTSKTDINNESEVTIRITNPNIINYSHLTSEQLNDIKKIITRNIEKLLNIDHIKLAYIIILLFSPDDWLSIYHEIVPKDSKYLFLKSILQLIFDLGPTIHIITGNDSNNLEILNNSSIGNISQNSKELGIQQLKEVTFSSDIIEITPKLNKMNNKKIKKKSKNEFTVVTMNSSTNYSMIQELITHILSLSFYIKGTPLLGTIEKGKAKINDSSEKEDNSSTKEFQITSPFILFKNDINDEYIELMCQYEPEQIIIYLKFIDETYQTYFYSTKKISEICKRYNVIDANAWIMEKSGDMNKALDCFLNYIQEQFNKINELLKGLDRALLNKDDIHYTIYGEIEEERLKPQIKTLFEIIEIQMEKAIDLCRRAVSISKEEKNNKNEFNRNSISNNSCSKSEKSIDNKALWYKLFITFARQYCRYKKYVINNESPIIKEMKKMELNSRKKSVQKIIRFIEEDKIKNLKNSNESIEKDKNLNVDEIFNQDNILENDIIDSNMKSIDEKGNEIEINNNNNDNNNIKEIKNNENKNKNENKNENENITSTLSTLTKSSKTSSENYKYKSNKNIIVDIWNDINLSDTLQNYLKTILNSMIGYISFPKLIIKLISEEKKDDSKYGEYKEIILLVIDMYNYELNLLKSVSKITMEDISQNTYLLSYDLHKAIKMDGHYCSLCKKKLISSPHSSLNRNPHNNNSKATIGNTTIKKINSYKESQELNHFKLEKTEIENDGSVVYFFCGHLFHKFCLYDYVINHPHFFSKLHTHSQNQSTNITNDSNDNQNRRESLNSISSKGSFNDSLRDTTKIERNPFWLKLCPICDDDDVDVSFSQGQQQLNLLKKHHQKIHKKNKKLKASQKTNLYNNSYLPLTLPYNHSSEMSISERKNSISSTSSSIPSQNSNKITLEQKLQKQKKGKLGILSSLKNKSSFTSDNDNNSSNVSHDQSSSSAITEPPTLPPKNYIKKEVKENNKEQQIVSLDQFELLTNSVPKYEILSEIEYQQAKETRNNLPKEGISQHLRNKLKYKTLPVTPITDRYESFNKVKGKGKEEDNDDDNSNNYDNDNEEKINQEENSYPTPKLTQSPTKSSTLLQMKDKNILSSSPSSSTTVNSTIKSKSTPVFMSNAVNFFSNLTSTITGDSDGDNGNDNSNRRPYQTINHQNQFTPPRLTDPNYVFSLLDTNKINDTYKLKLAPPLTPPPSTFLETCNNTHSHSHSPFSFNSKNENTQTTSTIITDNNNLLLQSPVSTTTTTTAAIVSPNSPNSGSSPKKKDKQKQPSS